MGPPFALIFIKIFQFPLFLKKCSELKGWLFIGFRIFVDIMTRKSLRQFRLLTWTLDIIYWSVRSYSRKGEDVENGVDGEGVVNINL